MLRAGPVVRPPPYPSNHLHPPRVDAPAPALLGKLVDVKAGGKGAVASAGDDDRCDVRVSLAGRIAFSDTFGILVTRAVTQ